MHHQAAVFHQLLKHRRPSLAQHMVSICDHLNGQFDSVIRPGLPAVHFDRVSRLVVI